MQKKKKTLSMSMTLLVVAMISLVGVGFALAYTGGAQTHIDDESGEAITVGIAKTGFTDGAIYTVNSMNNGTTVALSDLKMNGADQAASGKYFAYSSGFSLADADSGYGSAVAGTVTLTITQTEDAVANHYALAVSGTQAPVINQYGLSLVWTYKVGTGDETVFTPSESIPGVTLTDGAVTVVVNAYVVYSKSVPVANIGSISAFALADGDMTFTVTASTE